MVTPQSRSQVTSSSHMSCDGSVLLSASAGSEGTGISKSGIPGLVEDIKALGQDPSIPRARWSPQHLGNLSYGALMLRGIILSTV